MKTPTVVTFTKWCHDNVNLYLEMVAAREFAVAERARVDAYVKPIFEKYEFYDSFGGGKITEPKYLYAVEDLQSPEMVAYDDEVLAAHLMNGWNGNPNHCPALVAEYAATQVEQKFIESAAKMLGVDASLIFGQTRTDLLVQLEGACKLAAKYI